MATTVNEPRLERREAVISAKELLEKLRGIGSDRAPEYGIHLMRVAGQKIKLYDLSNTEVIVRAENIVHYMDKGFTIDVSDKTDKGVAKVSILEDKGMAHRHDTVPVREPGSTDIRLMFGENEEAIDGAKKGGEKPKTKPIRAAVAPPSPAELEAKAKADAEAQAKADEAKAKASQPITGGFISTPHDGGRS